MINMKNDQFTKKEVLKLMYKCLTNAYRSVIKVNGILI